MSIALELCFYEFTDIGLACATGTLIHKYYNLVYDSLMYFKPVKRFEMYGYII